MAFIDYGYGSGYGMRVHPITGEYKMHYGLDVNLSNNQPIESNVNGKVITSTYGSGFGNYVVVQDSNGYKHYYAHMNQRNVNVGDTVKVGQTLGLTGSTGNSTGAHLHYEVRDVNGNNVDPLPFAENVSTSGSSNSGFDLFGIGSTVKGFIFNILRVITIILVLIIMVVCISKSMDISLI